MTEELKNYLESSKEHRQKLKNLAQEIHKGHLKVKKDEEELAKDFPELNPKRFKNFEANLNEELKNIFNEDEIKGKNISEASTKGRSVSYHRKRIASIYNFLNVRAKRMSILPPIFRDKERSVPERLLAGKYSTSGSGMENLQTVESGNISIKRARITRFDVKKQLLKPILQKKYKDLTDNRSIDT